MQLSEIQKILVQVSDVLGDHGALKRENEFLTKRLLFAQSEALSAIQQNETKPEPRDIGHENVVSFVTRKSGEIQVSPGIVWGLVMDLIAKNPNHFGIDADACPEPVEPYTEPDADEPFEFRVGDRVRTKQNGILGTISDIDSKGINGTRRVFIDTISTQWFTDESLFLVCRMF
jgi:hypothetical protein